MVREMTCDIPEHHQPSEMQRFDRSLLVNHPNTSTSRTIQRLYPEGGWRAATSHQRAIRRLYPGTCTLTCSISSEGHACPFFHTFVPWRNEMSIGTNIWRNGSGGIEVFGWLRRRERSNRFISEGWWCNGHFSILILAFIHPDQGQILKPRDPTIRETHFEKHHAFIILFVRSGET